MIKLRHLLYIIVAIILWKIIYDRGLEPCYYTIKQYSYRGDTVSACFEYRTLYFYYGATTDLKKLKHNASLILKIHYEFVGGSYLIFPKKKRVFILLAAGIIDVQKLDNKIPYYDNLYWHNPDAYLNADLLSGLPITDLPYVYQVFDSDKESTSNKGSKVKREVFRLKEKYYNLYGSPLKSTFKY